MCPGDSAQGLGLTAPIVFVAAGFVFAEAFDLFDVGVDHELVKVIAEVTLVWVLFGDASQVRLSQFRRDLGSYVRLLGIGLPLTVALGTVVAIWVLGLDPWAALLLAAALAPTDAALGATVMSNPRVPDKVRSALNVESGLNDGIATPIVLVAIAGVAADEGIAGVEGPGRAVLALLVGVLVVSRSADSAAPSPSLPANVAGCPRNSPAPLSSPLPYLPTPEPCWSTATVSSRRSWADWSSAMSPDGVVRRRPTSSSSRAPWPPWSAGSSSARWPCP